MLDLHELGRNHAMTLQLTSRPYKVMCADEVETVGRPPHSAASEKLFLLLLVLNGDF